MNSDWNWENIWGCISVLVVLAGLSIVGMLLLSSHKTVGIELNTYSGSDKVCVVQVIEWAPDSSAFCSSDINQVLQVYDKLKKEIK